MRIFHRPVLHPHYACLTHWQETPCWDCLEDPKMRKIAWPHTFRHWVALRARVVVFRHLGWVRLSYEARRFAGLASLPDIELK